MIFNLKCLLKSSTVTKAKQNFFFIDILFHIMLQKNIGGSLKHWKCTEHDQFRCRNRCTTVYLKVCIFINFAVKTFTTSVELESNKIFGKA